ncbi:MAG: hypothetical protein L3J36_09615 [Rhodobacteraceae bacterium]|nr:hypothetical protein [Paracoccaceae bacterium]
MQMIRQDDEGVDGEGALGFCFGYRPAQSGYFTGQQVRAAIRKGDREEDRGSSDFRAAVIGHRTTMQGYG